MLQLVFLLDITGSMSAEIHGVQQTLSLLLESLEDTSSIELMLTIITFCENATQCFVSRHSFRRLGEAIRFVNRIKVSTPPHCPQLGAIAAGGDPAENHKAALWELTQLPPQHPTIAFLITDAPPHLLSQPSAEAGTEQRYLMAKNVTNLDVFALLRTIGTHFGRNLMLSVLKYNMSTDHSLYGAIAKWFHGVLITPLDREANQLASGLALILKQMMGRFLNQPSTVQVPKAFQFYDLTAISLDHATSEDDIKFLRSPTVDYSGTTLMQLLEQSTLLVGDKFRKRALVATALKQQIELLLVVAQYLYQLISKADAHVRINALMNEIVAAMPSDQLPAQFKYHKIQSIVLSSNECTVLDEDIRRHLIATLNQEGDEQELLWRLLECFQSVWTRIEFPNHHGKMDLMDVWSNVVTDSQTHLRSLVPLLHQNNDHQSNFAQVLCAPDDAFGTQLLRIASGTQVLNVVAGLLARAPPGHFVPNLFNGTLASFVLHLLWQPVSLNSYDLIHNGIHTIRTCLGRNCTKVAWNPADSMAKLLFGLVRMPLSGPNSDLNVAIRTEVRWFLEELLAFRIQKYAKFNQEAFEAFVETMVGYDHRSVPTPVSKKTKTQTQTKASASDDLVFHPLIDHSHWHFCEEYACERVCDFAIVQEFRATAHRLLEAVLGSKVWTVDMVFGGPDQFAALAVKLVLLEQRTARYFYRPKHPTMKWKRDENLLNQPVDAEVFTERAVTILRRRHASYLSQLMQRRTAHKTTQLVRLALDKFNASDPTEWERFLVETVKNDSTQAFKCLVQAINLYVEANWYDPQWQERLQMVVTGRKVEDGKYKILFNRGNLMAHPGRVFGSDFMPAQLTRHWRTTQVQHKWRMWHKYRSHKANRHGHNRMKPSYWATKRSLARHTFWEAD